ncbi:MAG TPA: MarR family transcriptional regulator [Candidatus Limnocylindrales bacterium]|jgi:DNA-binding MarR family transcriptional regulator|nr:MarR family transcriptional regulator [Candidatus Limnocylindrales bacterium]
MTEWSVEVDAVGSTERHSGQARTFRIDESLGYLVNRAARLMAGELAERLRPTGVGIGQWAVLLFLWARDGLTQAELARVVAIEPPTMVRTIDRMVRDGMVARKRDPSDARVSRIFLTDRGRALRDELVPIAMTVNEATLSRLSPSEGRTLRRLLAKLVS